MSSLACTPCMQGRTAEESLPVVAQALCRTALTTLAVSGAGRHAHAAGSVFPSSAASLPAGRCFRFVRQAM